MSESTLLCEVLSEQLIYSTIRIQVKTKTDTKIATGFFANFSGEELNKVIHLIGVSVLITNNHVFENAESLELFLHGGTDCKGELSPSGVPSKLVVNQVSLAKLWVQGDGDYDLGALLIDPIIELDGRAFFQTAFPSYFMAIDNEFNKQSFSALEEIVMPCFPVGLFDEFNNMPILRRGSTASHPAALYKGRNEGVVDIAAMYGASGSPIVFLHEKGHFGFKYGGTLSGGEKIMLMGVLYGGPVYSADGLLAARPVMDMPDPGKPNYYPINLGYYVKATEFVTLLESIEKRILELTRAGDYFFSKPFAVPIEEYWRKKQRKDKKRPHSEDET